MKMRQIIRILFGLKGIFIFIVIGVYFIITTCSKPTEPEEQEPPETLWTKTFGGSDNEFGNSVHQTSDGGYILTGYTWSYGAGALDVWLIKTDASGEESWTKTFGGSLWDVGEHVQQTSDGGYIITGSTYDDTFSEAYVWLIKTDASGNELWTKTFERSSWNEAYSVQQTSDGGYIITGHTHSDSLGDMDVWLIKTDTSGDTLWTKTFGRSEYDDGSSGQQTSDDGYIITGQTQSYGDYGGDVWLIKTDESGDTLWTRTFGGSSRDYGFSVYQTSDGGYIIAGYTESYGAGEYDVCFIKTDASGEELWTKTFGGSDQDVGRSVQQTSDGGYIITGYTKSLGAGERDVWLIKTDASGDSLWTKTFGGSDNDDGHSVQQTSDEGYIITGYTTSYGAGEGDVWLIRVAPE